MTSVHGAELCSPATGSQAKLEDFHFHDFTHNAVTRWALAGIPEELRKIAAGHSRGSVHQRYINPPDEMVRVFAEGLGWKNVYDVFTQELRTAEHSAN